jgi:hypothetical protein
MKAKCRRGFVRMPIDWGLARDYAARDVRSEETPVTEVEWLAATDPRPMLEFLCKEGAARGAVSCECRRVRCRRYHPRHQGYSHCPLYRKLRLFTLACCQPVMVALPDPVCRTALQSLHWFLEDKISTESYERAVERFDDVRRGRYPITYPDSEDDYWTALYCAVHRFWSHSDREEDFRVERRCHTAGRVAEFAASSEPQTNAKIQADWLRDIIGNPFTRAHAATPSRSSKSAGTVRSLANAVSLSSPFGHLPILADALEDAGCTDAELLGHLRGPGPHVRGCWALDLVLGKE